MRRAGSRVGSVMKAITYHEYGGPERLTVAEVPDPKVGPGEVLIRVKAAGVNPVDWKLATGGLDAVMPTYFPVTPGWDVAGVVEAQGMDAGDFEVGDEVIGYLRKDYVQHGTYAELASASVRLLARKPAALSWEQAAGLPLAGLTAYQALDRVGVGKGDTVLVHAAAGGVGVLAVQLARARGARVIGTASEPNHAFVRELGAEPVQYGEGLADRVRALAPDGVDAVVDLVGGVVDVSLELLRNPARLVSITDGQAAERGGHAIWVRPDAADLTALAELADEGRLTVPIHRTFPLERAADAWTEQQGGHAHGKIVLTVGG
jgi:NADPH:quinone reductase-like Zn-dependent oxidoreductase